MCDNKQLSKLNSIRLELIENKVVSFLSNKTIGFSKSLFKLEEININQYASAPNVIYYYSGPLDEKTRAFCKQLLDIDKFYTQEDLDYMSKYLGYDVQEYEGAYNCRHSWKKAKVTGLIKDQIEETGSFEDEATSGQIRRAAAKGIIVN